MIDSIIAGTGNSRYLKSVANFLQKYPTYQSFAQALIAGTLPIDLNGINQDGFSVLGDSLNKATLLKDATAALFGLQNTAVPDDVLAILANAVVVKDGNLETPSGVQVPGVKTVYGSYQGTGTSNVSLSLPFLADLLFVGGEGDGRQSGVCCSLRGVPYADHSDAGDRVFMFRNIVFSETNVSWESVTSSKPALGANASGQTYYYCAIGNGG